MKSALIGYTGFVGGNLVDKMSFDDLYNSTSINNIIGKEYDLLVCAGVRAEKYLANLDPKADWLEIERLFNILKQVRVKRFILISTVDVYKEPINVNEDTDVVESELQPYGLHRYKFERMILHEFNTVHIIRLPGLFGQGLKKNFIFDLMDKIPSMLNDKLFNNILAELSVNDKVRIQEFYSPYNKAFIRKANLSREEKLWLRQVLGDIGVTSVNFTDSRSEFQFYNLNNLAVDIEKVVENDLKTLNLSTAPVRIDEIYKKCFGSVFVNEVENRAPVYYNMFSKHANLWGSNRYMYSKEVILKEISDFVHTNINNY